VNLDGVFLSVKYAVAAMRRTGCGSIIMPSVAGIRGSAGLAGYCATKGGVRLFAKVAMECAAADDGNRVNTVYPGSSTRRSGTKLPAPTGSNAPIDPSEVAKTGGTVRKGGQTKDIANGLRLFASDMSSYMTGAALVIDGGVMGWRAISLD
jgi:NAD(P)-dependent dehydrogenase (short-subunit alcohol dehydrogenase family)